VAAAGSALRHGLHHHHPHSRPAEGPDAGRERPVLGTQLARKLLVLDFPDLTPPTTIARDIGVLREFKARHGDIILKPLYGNGGAGVFRLDPNDRNLASLHELFTGMSREPLIAQKFLPDVSAATSGSSLSTGSRWARSTVCPPRVRRGRTCMWADGPRRPR
jgi:predicted ATP-grasp superfamily ATP-dependent carboligase